MSYTEEDEQVISSLWGDLLNYTDVYDVSPEVKELIHNLFDQVDDFKNEMEEGEEDE